MTQQLSDRHRPETELARVVAGFCRERALPVEARGFPQRPVWQTVRDAGSELWLDSADLDHNLAVWTQEFDGLTTNNALLNAEVQKGRYDDIVPAAAEAVRSADPTLPVADLVLELAFVVNAIQGMALAATFEADVSVELHTDLVRDIDGSYQFGRRFAELCPERFVVKIALTPEGLIAAHRLEQDGIRVNCTLGFSPRQNHLIAGFAKPHFVNVFVGRVNALFGDRVQAGPAERLQGVGEVSALTSQRVLRRMQRAGVVPEHTRQIAASMRDSGQVADLAGVDVLTMPPAVAEQLVADASAVERIVDQTGDLDGDVFCNGDSSGSEVERFLRVGQESRIVAAQLHVRGPDVLDGGRIRAVLRDCGMGDLFPELDDGERRRVVADGKIPDREAWQARVADGSASWDGLLTEAALADFAARQAELDARLLRVAGT